MICSIRYIMHDIDSWYIFHIWYVIYNISCKENNWYVICDAWYMKFDIELNTIIIFGKFMKLRCEQLSVMIMPSCWFY